VGPGHEVFLLYSAQYRKSLVLVLFSHIFTRDRYTLPLDVVRSCVKSMNNINLCLQLSILLVVVACQQTTPIADVAIAQKNSTILTEAVVEQAPSTVATTIPVETPEQLADTDLWHRVRAGFTLDHEIDRNRVKQELDWFVKHPDYIKRVADRARKYLFHIVGQLEQNNLPLEFALLPVVESAYDPFAYSHGRAAGLWQFIPATARFQGLKIDWWYDGRRDVIDSTDAAARYLNHLHERMDEDWLLALASYNSGEGNVRSAMRKNARKSKALDFWSLDLNQETTSYVPRLLALCAVIDNPSAYGIELEPIENNAYWQTVDIGSQIDLSKAAALADLDSRELYQLNPGFNQWSTHPEGPHRLLVPVSNAEQFAENLANLAGKDRMTWTRHKINDGESLGSIAQEYGTTVTTLRSVNGISGSLIRTGDSLLIPVASMHAEYPMTAEARLRQDQSYWAQQYGAKPVRHVVQPGDSLWKLSRRHRVSMRNLAKWNGIGTTSTLYPGSTLLVFNASSDPSSDPSSDIVRKLSYRVRQGESFAKIADKFNLTIGSIKSWNKKAAAARYLQPGDSLTLFVDVTSME
jgi:membrane-bound lytic murein transglycosylase D